MKEVLRIMSDEAEHYSWEEVYRLMGCSTKVGE
jgi:hypothetical protein